MVVMDAEVVDVREGIVLGLEALAGDLLHELLDVRGDRLEAECLEDLAVQLAHLRADADPATVLGCSDRPHTSREVAEAVVPVSEEAAGGPVVHPLPGDVAVLAVQRPEGRAAVLDDERQLEQLQLRRRPREAYRGHVAERQLAALDHRNQIARGTAQLEDAADQLEIDVVAEPLGQQLAEARRGAVVDGRGLLIAAELDDQFHGRVVDESALLYHKA
jgi:hypothetical protein